MLRDFIVMLTKETRYKKIVSSRTQLYEANISLFVMTVVHTVLLTGRLITPDLLIPGDTSYKAFVSLHLVAVESDIKDRHAL